MDYSKGEHVVYGSNGVCLIEDISSLSYPGDGAERTYYTLRPLNSPSSTLYVPADNEQLCARIRRVLTPEQVESIVAGTKGDKMEWNDDRKQRIAGFRDLINRGDIRGIILMACCIYNKRISLRGLGKHLSDADEHMLRSAERMVDGELSWSLGIPESQVSSYIRGVLGIAD